MTAQADEDRVRTELSGEKKSEDPRGPETGSGLERVRKARQESLESEPGYKLGKSLGQKLKRSSLVILPIEMALAPVLLTLGGWWIDRRLDTFPGVTLFALVFGLTVAVRAVVRAIGEVSK